MGRKSISKEKVRSFLSQETLAGYGFVALPMALFLTLNVGVFFYAFYISLFKWQILGPVEMIGFQNYVDMFEDEVFIKALRNSLIFAVCVVPLQTAMGLFLALLVNSRIRGHTVFRATFYFPSVASSAATTTLFIFILAPDGIFNSALAFIGVAPETLFNGGGWLNDARSALGSVVVLIAWTTSGTMMLFYLGYLQGLDANVFEAARTDGASSRQIFWLITMPLLRPAHFFVVVTGMIGAMQMFDQAILAGGVDGSPDYSLMTVVLYVYNASFRQFQFGYAAAVGIVLFAVILGATLLQRWFFGRAAWRGVEG